jgi:predicted transposase YbfD/YdcC
MGMRLPSSFQDNFVTLTDPRCPYAPNSRHLLMDILVIAVCAVISGAEGWEDIEEYGKAQAEWFADLLDLPHGIPGHDTFRRVLSQVDPEEFTQCFIAWTNALHAATAGDIVAIDGKTLRHSFDRATATTAIHMVSAWASAHRLVLGQLKVEEKSNEITAIPALLQLLDVTGAVVTIDAMGCQKEIAQTIVERGAEYVLALKENHPTLYEDVTLFLNDARDTGFTDVEHAYHETVDGGHGRIETRRYWITSQIEWLGAQASWANLHSVGMVESRREIGETVQIDTRYFLTSLPAQGIRFAQSVRQHWGIENALHWVLDVSFNEDACRIRKDQGAQIFAVLRHIALNLLRHEPHHKRGIKARRKRAGWDRDYLVQVLTG